jgi:hypothetical protein
VLQGWERLAVLTRSPHPLARFRQQLFLLHKACSNNTGVKNQPGKEGMKKRTIEKNGGGGEAKG